LVTVWQSLDPTTPWWRMRMSAERTYRVHTPSEIVFEADLTVLGDYDAAATYRLGNIARSLTDGNYYVWIAQLPGSNIAPPNAAYWDLYEVGPTANTIRYSNNLTLEQLRPAQAGADVTLSHTAAGIVSQGPGATAVGSDVLNNSIDGGVVRIPRPLGGTLYIEHPSVAGAIKIKLPIAKDGDGGPMLRFLLEVFEYGEGLGQKYEISAYWEDGATEDSWFNPTVRLVGGSAAARIVRFGHDGVNPCIWIGNHNGTWAYPAAVVTEVQVSFRSTVIGNWASGWNVSLDTNPAQNVTRTITQPTAGDAVFGVNALEAWGGSVATLANFRTNLGIAAAIAAQGSLATRSNARVGWEIVDEAGAYLPPAYIRNNNNTASGNGFVARPLGGEFSYNSPNVPGAIQIKLPNLIGDARYCMVKFQVDIFDYNSGATVTYDIAGYCYAYEISPAFINCTAKVVGGGSAGTVKTVRFGRTSSNGAGRFCVWIGDVSPATQWQYPQVVVRNLMTGYSHYSVEYWQAGWEITTTTAAFPFVDVTVLNPTAGDAVFGVNTLEAWNGSVATLANFRTNLGISSGISGQGPWATDTSLAPGTVTAKITYLQIDGTMRLGNTNGLMNAAGSAWLTDANTITALGISSGFSGQGALATANVVSYSSQISGLPGAIQPANLISGHVRADWLRFVDGDQTSIQSLKPAELGANVTANWTSAGFAGQSPWATFNGLVPTNVVGQVQHLTTGGNLTATAVFGPGTIFLNDRWPAELGANVTETRTSSAIAGQSPWATFSGLVPSNVAGQIQNLNTSGNLDSLTRVIDRRITQTFRADGTTTVTESLVITSLGIASAVIGQGTGATANTLAQLDPAAASQLAGATSGGGSLTVGLGDIRQIRLAAGASRALNAQAFLEAGGNNGTLKCRIEVREAGGAFAAWITSADDAFVGPGEPAGNDVAGTYTNTTGSERLFEFRAVAIRNPVSAGGTVRESMSFLTG